MPVIPLGVRRPRGSRRWPIGRSARARRRAALGLGEADVLVLWVGRLSFFEKAYPQPMFRAVQRAAAATGAQGRTSPWPAGSRARRTAALRDRRPRGTRPTSTVRFLDGNDRELLGELWAAADIFLSLVDNIQETFGITPLEAMAAGLPVVASDWDGYRYTMRDGVEGVPDPDAGRAARRPGRHHVRAPRAGGASLPDLRGEPWRSSPRCTWAGRPRRSRR